uniref:Uncharacterized protein n=1 Tax=Ciona intestinalis TaxID=7719 RepID=H2XQ92_CIOIN
MFQATNVIRLGWYYRSTACIVVFLLGPESLSCCSAYIRLQLGQIVRYFHSNKNIVLWTLNLFYV